MMVSLRNAINAMCRSCIYDPGNGNGKWREQVTACTSSNCPLHPIRPRSAAKSGRRAPKQPGEAPRHNAPITEANIDRKNGQIDRSAPPSGEP